MLGRLRACEQEVLVIRSRGECLLAIGQSACVVHAVEEENAAGLAIGWRFGIHADCKVEVRQCLVFLVLLDVAGGAPVIDIALLDQLCCLGEIRYGGNAVVLEAIGGCTLEIKLTESFRFRTEGAGVDGLGVKGDRAICVLGIQCLKRLAGQVAGFSHLTLATLGHVRRCYKRLRHRAKNCGRQ